MNFNELFKKYGLQVIDGCIVKHILGFTVTGKYYEETIQYKPTESKTIKNIIYNNFPCLYDFVRDSQGKQGIQDLVSDVERLLAK